MTTRATFTTQAAVQRAIAAARAEERKACVKIVKTEALTGRCPHDWTDWEIAIAEATVRATIKSIVARIRKQQP